MQHSEHNRFNSYRPAFLLGGLVSAQRTSSVSAQDAVVVPTRINSTKGSHFRQWFKSKMSRHSAN